MIELVFLLRKLTLWFLGPPERCLGISLRSSTVHYVIKRYRMFEDEWRSSFSSVIFDYLEELSVLNI
jgi:hypothetical protein